MSKSRNGWEMLPGQEVMKTKGFDIWAQGVGKRGGKAFFFF